MTLHAHGVGTISCVSLCMNVNILSGGSVNGMETTSRTKIWWKHVVQLRNAVKKN